MAETKRPFSFAAGASQAPEVRGANALEFIASYLDRIEGHLERLAIRAELANGDMTKIALQLTTVAHLLGDMAKK